MLVCIAQLSIFTLSASQRSHCLHHSFRFSHWLHHSNHIVCITGFELSLLTSECRTCIIYVVAVLWRMVALNGNMFGLTHSEVRSSNFRVGGLWSCLCFKAYRTYTTECSELDMACEVKLHSLSNDYVVLLRARCVCLCCVVCAYLSLLASDWSM